MKSCRNFHKPKLWVFCLLPNSNSYWSLVKYEFQKSAKTWPIWYRYSMNWVKLLMNAQRSSAAHMSWSTGRITFEAPPYATQRLFRTYTYWSALGFWNSSRFEAEQYTYSDSFKWIGIFIVKILREKAEEEKFSVRKKREMITENRHWS